MNFDVDLARDCLAMAERDQRIADRLVEFAEERLQQVKEDAEKAACAVERARRQLLLAERQAQGWDNAGRLPPPGTRVRLLHFGDRADPIEGTGIVKDIFGMRVIVPDGADGGHAKSCTVTHFRLIEE